LGMPGCVSRVPRTGAAGVERSLKRAHTPAMVLRRQDKRGLTTLLFTDIVSSSDVAVELGDRRWRQLQGRHHAEVRKQLRRQESVQTCLGSGRSPSFDLSVLRNSYTDSTICSRARCIIPGYGAKVGTFRA
jgi:hypothetical protein